MPRTQTQFPDWWKEARISARRREKLASTYTITGDGYAVWYKGKTRFAATKGTPPDQVDAVWDAKRKAIDARDKGEPAPVDPQRRAYRLILSDFITHLERRVQTGKPRPLAPRTLHNLDVALNDFGNYVYQGEKVGDMALERVNNPALFADYIHKFGDWRASAFDSVVCRVSTLFRWAVRMEYLERFRPGPAFQRPGKQEIRDDRIALAKSYSPDEIAKLYRAASYTLRCWIALGVCAAFNNSDIAHLTRGVVDLQAGTVDYRRRKTGKVRRVIPLPVDVAELLRNYQRPTPVDAGDGELFFLTREGRPFNRTKSEAYEPSSTISRLWYNLERDAGVDHLERRSFSGLRTTFYNSVPVGYDLERKIIMGRAKGDIDLDHYLEDVGIERLRHVTHHVWSKISTSPVDAAPAPGAAPKAGVSRRRGARSGTPKSRARGQTALL